MQIRNSVRMIEDAASVQAASVVIEGAACPDGSEAQNSHLSRKRAQSVGNYLRTLPGLDHVDFSIIDKGEDWDSFIEEVRNNYFYYNRDELLRILGSDQPNSVKKQRIMAMDRGRITWQILVQDYMMSSRYASVNIIFRTDGSVDLYSRAPEPVEEPVYVAGSVETYEPEVVVVPTVEAATVAYKPVVDKDGIDWYALTEEVRDYYTYYNRDALLRILEADIPNSVKKQRIMTMDHGNVTWQILLLDFIGNPRHAPAEDREVERSPMEDVARPLNPPTLAQPEGREQMIYIKKWKDKPPRFQPWGDSPSYILEELYHKPDRLMSDDKTPIASIRTNLLVPALNLGAELPLGNNLSIAADYYYPWFWPDEKNKNCFEFLGASVEGRYWFGSHRMPSDRLRGHSVGVYFAAGYYDFEKDYRGMQGEFYSPGLDYTYSRTIGKKSRVNLSFTLAFGYIRSVGRTYDVHGDYGALYPDDNTVIWNYFGPTKAAVSLVVPFYRKEGRR